MLRYTVISVFAQTLVKQKNQTRIPADYSWNLSMIFQKGILYYADELPCGFDIVYGICKKKVPFFCEYLKEMVPFTSVLHTVMFFACNLSSTPLFGCP